MALVITDEMRDAFDRLQIVKAGDFTNANFPQPK